METIGKKNKRSKEKTALLHSFFRKLWDERENESGSCYCYESGRELPGWVFRSNSCCYHHILDKSNFSEFEFEPWNIVILHPEVHTLVESNIDKCPKVKALTEKIREEHL